MQYINAFNKADLDAILSLFSETALIYSPTQSAPKTPLDFYSALLPRSKNTNFTAKAIFGGEDGRTAAILFDYKKTTPESVIVFDCVDICTFDDDNKIIKMSIIFDTKKLGL